MKKSIKSRIQALESEIAELKKDYRPLRKWIPTKDQNFLYISVEGKAQNKVWTNSVEDNYMLWHGNCFQNIAALDRVKQLQETEARLRELSYRSLKSDPIYWLDDSKKFFFMYSPASKEFSIGSTDLMTQGTIFFPSYDDAVNAWESIGEQKIIDLIKNKEDLCL